MQLLPNTFPLARWSRLQWIKFKAKKIFQSKRMEHVLPWSQHKLNFCLWDFHLALPAHYENKWRPYVLTFISVSFITTHTQAHAYTQYTIPNRFLQNYIQTLEWDIFLLVVFFPFDYNTIFIFFYWMSHFFSHPFRFRGNTLQTATHCVDARDLWPNQHLRTHMVFIDAVLIY